MFVLRLLLLLYTPCVRGSISTLPTQSYPHEAVLDEDGAVKLYWLYDDSFITFEIHALASGWVGLGLSPAGGMPGSDIALGWVDSTGQVHLQDTHAETTGRPSLDASQDLELLSGAQTNGVTSLKFRRKLIACDDDDMDVVHGTNRIIYAYTNTYPENLAQAVYHGTNRGTKSIHLLSGERFDYSAEETTTIRVLNSDVKVPANDTTYHCQAFKFPELSEKHHVIKVSPVIQAGNEGLVHHITMYRCYHEVHDRHDGFGFLCYTGPMPGDLHRCISVFAGWAIGGGSFTFPPDVGFPVGPGHGPGFLLMETHFDNPKLESGRTDNSGLELVLTSRLRRHDAGIIDAGQAVSLTQLIPPGVSDFVHRATCPGRCLEKAGKDADTQSVRFFASMLHSHLLGRRVDVHVVRHGEVVGSLGSDRYYDFNLQEFRMLPREVPVRRTDDIVVDCVYDSSERRAWTMGGLSSRQEMCMAFLYYYPATELTVCQSLMLPQAYMHFIGATDWDRRNLTIKAPRHLAGKNFIQVLSEMKWSEETLGDFRKLQYRDDLTRVAYCIIRGESAMTNETFTTPAFEVTEPEREKSALCSANRNARATLLLIASLLIACR